MPATFLPTVHDLAEHQRLLADAGKALDQFGASLGSRLGHLLWQGPAAEEFRAGATGQRRAAADAAVILTTLVGLLGRFDQDLGDLRASIEKAETTVTDALARGARIPAAVSTALKLEPGQLPHDGSSAWLTVAHALQPRACS